MSRYLVGYTMLLVGFVNLNLIPSSVIDSEGVLHEALALSAWSWILMLSGGLLLLALFIGDRRKS